MQLSKYFHLLILSTRCTINDGKILLSSFPDSGCIVDIIGRKKYSKYYIFMHVKFYKISFYGFFENSV